MNLFDPLKIRDITFRNRIAVSPMCEYSSEDGFANDWHLVHLGSRAVGGAGLVFTEATAVAPEGRISPADLGIWKDEHIEPLARIVRFVQRQGAVAGIQLAHAGRKASTYRALGRPRRQSRRRRRLDARLRPAPIAFADNYPARALHQSKTSPRVVDAFAAAARRALEAGFQRHRNSRRPRLPAPRIPLAAQQSPHRRIRRHLRKSHPASLREIVAAVREVVARASCRCSSASPPRTGSRAAGTSSNPSNSRRSVEAAGRRSDRLLFRRHRADAKIPLGPGYQVRLPNGFAARPDILTGAVGMITDARAGRAIIATGQADMVLLAREFLRDPYWPLRAAQELKQPITWPKQYERARF